MLWLIPLVIAALLLMPRAAQAYVGGLPVDVELAPIGDGFSLRVDAAMAFLQMRAAAAKVGVHLDVNSAFRTMDEQNELYGDYVAGTGNLAAKPGYSNHQGGIAVDIETDGTSTSIYLWLVNHAPTYGFRRTVSTEPWHWEFRP